MSENSNHTPQESPKPWHERTSARVVGGVAALATAVSLGFVVKNEFNSPESTSLVSESQFAPPPEHTDPILTQKQQAAITKREATYGGHADNVLLQQANPVSARQTVANIAQEECWPDTPQEFAGDTPRQKKNYQQWRKTTYARNWKIAKREDRSGPHNMLLPSRLDEVGNILPTDRSREGCYNWLQKVVFVYHGG